MTPSRSPAQRRFNKKLGLSQSAVMRLDGLGVKEVIIEMIPACSSSRYTAGDNPACQIIHRDFRFVSYYPCEADCQSICDKESRTKEPQLRVVHVI